MLIIDRYWYSPRAGAKIRVLPPLSPKKAIPRGRRKFAGSPPPPRVASSFRARASPSPAERVNRCTSCSPQPQTRQTHPSEKKSNRCASCSPQPQVRQTHPQWSKGVSSEEEKTLHWTLRRGEGSKFGESESSKFGDSTTNDDQSIFGADKSLVHDAAVREVVPMSRIRRRSKRQKVESSRSGIVEKDALKRIILIPAEAAEKKAHLRKALRIHFAEYAKEELLQTANQEILKTFSKGIPDVETCQCREIVELFYDALWRYQPPVVHNVWRDAVHQVVDQEYAKRRQVLDKMKSASPIGRSNTIVSERPRLHRQNTKPLRDADHGEEADDGSAEDAEKSAREKVWRASFGRLSQGFRLSLTDLSKALELSGFPYANVSTVEKIFTAMIKGNTISCDEYIKGLYAYVEQQRAECHRLFKQFDSDDSDTIDVGELADALKACGMEPLPHVLESLTSEVDKDRSGQLNFGEFQQLMELFTTQEGFTASERQELEDFFLRIEHTDADHVSIDVLEQALGWLGYSMKVDEIDVIARQVDVDGGGTLDWMEFLRCLRKVREREIKMFNQRIAEYDKDGSGTLCLEELHPLLHSLGYICDLQAVKDAAEDVGVDQESLGLHDLWKFLHLYRKREGLSREECNEVRAAFERYDSKQTGEISHVDLGKALRWFGYQVSFEVQQHLQDSVDVDRSGRLNELELRKMIRMYWEGELQRMQAAFAEQLASTRSRTCTREQVERAFLQLNFVDATGRTPAVPSCNHGEGIDLTTFMSIGVEHKKEVRDVFRQNAGYSHDQIQQMRELFNIYDKDGSDSIGTNELGPLISDIFSTMNKNIRDKLDFLMREIDADGLGMGKLTFDDFLRMMRQFSDIQNGQKVEKEACIVEATGFTFQEVQGFRDLFVSCDTNNDNYMSVDEVKNMVQNVFPLGNKNAHDLAVLLQEVRDDDHCKLEGSQNGKSLFDFPDFLLLLRKMLDSNFGNLQDKLGIGSMIGR